MAHQPVIIGASWGALVCGAALAKRGIAPIVIEASPLIGGRTASQVRGGYAIDLGHRSARSAGDPLLMLSRRFKAALLAATDVDLLREPAITPKLAIHHMPSKSVVVLDGSATPFRDFAEKILGVPAERVDDFLTEIDTLRRLSPEQVARLLPVSIAQWLEGKSDPVMREAFSRWAEAEWLVPQSETSVGRFVQTLQANDLEYIVANDPERPGASGYSLPFADKIAEAGGTLTTDVELLEILIENARVRGVVVRDPMNMIRTIETDTVIFCEPPGRLLEVTPPSTFSLGFTTLVEGLAKWGGFPGAAAYFGLSALPRRASDGKVEDHAGWHRLLAVGPNDIGAYAGGWMVASLTRPNRAPAGKHLIWCGCGNVGPITYRDVVREMNVIRDYMRGYYRDFDAMVEWSDYQMIAPFAKGYARMTGARPPHRPAEVAGLYLVDSAIDSEAFYYYDIDVEIGLRVAEEIVSAR